MSNGAESLLSYVARMEAWAGLPAHERHAALQEVWQAERSRRLLNFERPPESESVLLFWAAIQHARLRVEKEQAVGFDAREMLRVLVDAPVGVSDADLHRHAAAFVGRSAEAARPAA